jgi:hypothetical protein
MLLTTLRTQGGFVRGSDHSRDSALACCNMSTLHFSFVECQEVSGKRTLKHSKPANEATPAVIIAEHTTEDKDLAVLQNWLEGASSGGLKLQNISYEQAEGLQEKLREAGHKIKYVDVDTL